ncbi:MAG: hypothetical protein IJ776_03640 [Paludibacteraceae bacterium]|nr:hypothetical protein [Paludibacteraceae bacterium]
MNQALRYISLAISIVLYPMLIPAYAMLLLFGAFSSQGLDLPWLYKVITVGGTLLLTCIIPFSIILMMIKQGQLKDAYIEDKEARLTPYLYSIFSSIAWCFYLWRVVHMPHIVCVMAIGATVALVVVTIINHWWKISSHLSTLGALIGSVAGYQYANPATFNLWLIPSLLGVSLMLACARIYLNAHTSMQTVAGLLLGLLFTMLPAMLF